MEQAKFDRQLNKLYASYGELLGRRIPQNMRESLERQNLIGNYPDENLLEDLKATMEWEIPRMKMVLELVKNDRKSTNVKRLPFAVKLVTLERRLAMVYFIVGHNATLFRIDWVKMVAKWNQAYPYQTKHVESLKAEYNRALREPEAKLQRDIAHTLLVINLCRNVYKKVLIDLEFYLSKGRLSSVESLVSELKEYAHKYILAPYRELPYRPKFLRDSIVRLWGTIIEVFEIQLAIANKKLKELENKGNYT